MREILFRGKRTDNGQWVEGWAYPFTNGGYVGKDNRMCIRNGMYAKDIYEIAPETVGQYTGLTDKNGRKIFEGDIIKDVDTGKVFSIEWHEPAFVRVDNRRYFFWDMCAESYEVIGNIYESPELLKD